jgi:hypothetical protein
MCHAERRFYAECKFEDFRTAHAKYMYALYPHILINPSYYQKTENYSDIVQERGEIINMSI